MIATQLVKPVAVLGLVAALAACGRSEQAPKAEAAPVTAGSENPTAMTATQTPAGGVLIDQMMGVQVAYLESKLGPAKTISGQTRTYEIGACTVEVRTDGSEIAGYVVPMTPACSAQALAALKTYDLPEKIDLTMGEFAQARQNVEFKADCLSLCGNAADPSVYLESAGPRVSPGIRAEAVMVTDATIDASTRIENAIKAAKGEDYVIDTRFNCSSEFNTLAVQELKSVRIDQIEVGYVPMGGC